MSDRPSSEAERGAMISAVPVDGGGKVSRIRDTSAQDRPIDPQPKLQQQRYKLIAAVEVD